MCPKRNQIRVRGNGNTRPLVGERHLAVYATLREGVQLALKHARFVTYTNSSFILREREKNKANIDDDPLGLEKSGTEVSEQRRSIWVFTFFCRLDDGKGN